MRTYQQHSMSLNYEILYTCLTLIVFHNSMSEIEFCALKIIVISFGSKWHFLIYHFIPGWQKHRNPSSWSTQIPCTQGDDSHLEGIWFYFLNFNNENFILIQVVLAKGTGETWRTFTPERKCWVCISVNVQWWMRWLESVFIQYWIKRVCVCMRGGFLLKFNIQMCLDWWEFYLKCVVLLMHVPPLRHCEGLHGSASYWQFFPV